MERGIQEERDDKQIQIQIQIILFYIELKTIKH